MDKINITLTEDAGKPIVIHVLEGEAPKNVYPSQLTISGNISAVKDYISVREQQIHKPKSYIMFNEIEQTIKLTQNEDSDIPTTVTGKLEIHPDLADFGINTPKYRGRQEMEKLIRMNRFYFPDKEDHAKLVASFNKFSAKVQSELESSSNNRGNKNLTFDKQVHSDLVERFTLNIPIHKGGLRKTFLVEICFDVTDAAARFWLESVELFELEKAMTAEEFEDNRRYFTDLGFTVISA